MNDEKLLATGETKSEFWLRHLALWKESGLNIREYCELEELSKNAFGYWRRKLNSPKPPADGFVELKLSSCRSDGMIHIRLSGGLELGVVTGTDTKYLSELVSALERG
jgi:hypothetical protein